MQMYGCELWNIMDFDVDKFYVAWRKVKRHIWKLPNTAHNRIIHNIASNIHIILEKRLIKFIHSALNGSDVCKQFTQISHTSWVICKVKIKQLLLYPVSHDASVLHDLCAMRDDDFCGIFTTAQVIIDISIN